MKLQYQLLRAARPVNDYLISNRDSENRDFRRFEIIIDKDFRAVEKASVSKEVRMRIGEARTKWQAARQSADLILRDGESLADGGYAKMKRFDAQIYAASDLLEDAHEKTEVVVNNSLGLAQQRYRQTFALATALFLFSMAGMAIYGMWAIRAVVRPIGILRKDLRKFGDGHLEQRISLKSGDEFELLANDFNWMADRLQESQETLHKLSINDDLTGLNNYREFQRILVREFKAAHRAKKPLSLLMIDVDNLKESNDAFGHLIGDEVLKMVAQGIKSQMREVDWAARYGGDEFSVILPETPEDGAKVIAERIRAAVGEEKISLGNHIIDLSVSIGCAELSSTMETEIDLVHAADKALYLAKHSGRNQVSGLSERQPL